MTSYKTKAYRCDNPACQTTRPELEPDIEPALGFHFRGILHVHDGGGDSFAMDTFACSPNCLGPAVVHAWERYQRGDES